MQKASIENRNTMHSNFPGTRNKMYRASIENRNIMHSKTRKPTNLTQISQGQGTKCIELV